MRVTTKGRYALRAMLALARMGRNGELVSINSLAEAENISSVFLEQIFFKLKKAGIVKSVRGPGGGFNFAYSLDKLTVKAILDAAGEDLSSGTCDKHEDKCAREAHCVSHRVWVNMSSLVNNYLSGITLAALLEEKDRDERLERVEPISS